MFHAKSKHPGKFKTLFEILFQNMAVTAFTINKKGIFLETRTTLNSILSIELPAEKFEEYEYELDTPTVIGLNQLVSKQFFSSINNKGEITFAIVKSFDENDASLFQMNQYDASTCLKRFSIKIEMVQNILPITFPTYIKPFVEIEKSSFNQMCRSLNSSHDLTISRQNNRVYFASKTGISVISFEFGEIIPTDQDLIQEVYESEQILRIKKVASFIKDPIKIYFEKDRHLLLVCTGVIGDIKIYLNHQQTE